MNPISNHPNASAATLAGALVTISVWGASVAGLAVPPEVSASAVTVVVAALLLVGRRGSSAAD